MLLAAASVASGAPPADAQAGAQAAAQPAAQPAAQAAVPDRVTAPSQPPVVIDAAFSRVDYTTNTVVFRNINVSQGDTRLTANRARAAGVGFANSQWTFEEGVVIELVPRGTLRCDQAVVTFRDNRITGARATGKPAQFEQRQSGSRRPAHGSADRITFDARNDSVRLIGHARFADARGLEVSGAELLYDIRNERLQADSTGERRGVHITLTPEDLPKSRQSSTERPPRQ